jgi:hypothetical protein
MALQVTFDCHDPHAQAAFWAVAAVGFEPEDHHDMIGDLIEGGQVPADSDDVDVVDGRRRWHDYAALKATDAGDGDRLLFQRGDDPKTAKNRVHLDIHVPDGERDAHVARLLDLGATRLWEASQGPMSWVTLADPEGNELCIS